MPRRRRLTGLAELRATDSPARVACVAMRVVLKASSGDAGATGAPDHPTVPADPGKPSWPRTASRCGLSRDSNSRGPARRADWRLEGNGCGRLACLSLRGKSVAGCGCQRVNIPVPQGLGRSAQWPVYSIEIELTTRLTPGACRARASAVWRVRSVLASPVR